MSPLDIAVLAAGKGTRMLSSRPKVMHPIMGRPMIGHVVEAARNRKPHRIVVVTGHGRDMVEEYLKDGRIDFAFQDPQLGTAHALIVCGDLIGSNDLLVLYGDVPLLKDETLENLAEAFGNSEGIVFMTTETATPEGYGRVVMKNGFIEAIVEHNDATEEERKIREINTGICMLRSDRLSLLHKIRADNAKGEYYLTDICLVAKEEGIRVTAYHHPDSKEVLGVNTREDQQDANVIMNDRKLDSLMSQGVTVVSRNVFVESDVRIGTDTILYPNCYVGGKARIGRDVVIGPNAVVIDSEIRDGAVIGELSRVRDVVVPAGACVGPSTDLAAWKISQP